MRDKKGNIKTAICPLGLYKILVKKASKLWMMIIFYKTFHLLRVFLFCYVHMQNKCHEISHSHEEETHSVQIAQTNLIWGGLGGLHAAGEHSKL